MISGYQEVTAGIKSLLSSSQEALQSLIKEHNPAPKEDASKASGAHTLAELAEEFKKKK
jgi:hypothetical protein